MVSLVWSVLAHEWVSDSETLCIYHTFSSMLAAELAWGNLVSWLSRSERQAVPHAPRDVVVLLALLDC